MTTDRSERHPVDRLAEEFLARYRRGERPSISEYARLYPDLAAELEQLLTALTLMEEHGPGAAAPRSDNGTEGPVNDGRIPERLGEYRILREIGRGGMGVVYEAVQESLGRPVALKVLPAAGLLDPTRLKRFQREVQAAARLHHTNIVPVFGVSESDGVRYYSMQFIPGRGLDTVIDEVRQLRDVPGSRTSQADSAGERRRAEEGITLSAALSTESDSPRYYRSVARLGEQVAEALAHAHREGILHRDIKPANLLLDARGTVWVTDFGLATGEGMEELTNTGDIVGTLRYMAPERLEGIGDARADVYSLGLTLYELLTLRPAFDAPDRAALIRQIAAANPPRPRKVDPRIPRDLETIVLKACAREPTRRYAEAGELADDLRRFLVNRPIQARRTPWWELAWRGCRRNPGISIASAAALAALLVGLGAALWQWRRADESFQRAETNSKLARRDYQLASRAVDQMLTRVGDEHLLNVPHMEQTRRELLNDALRFYEELLKDADERPEARLEMARAHWRVANIHAWLGDFPPAVRHYDHAMNLTQESTSDDRASADWRQLRAAIYHHRGWLRDHLEQLTVAENDYRQALAIWEELVSEAPSSAEYRYGLASTLQRLGLFLFRTSRPDLEVYQRRALDLAQKLKDAQPEHPKPQRLLVLTLDNLAVTLQRLGDLQGAERLHRQALELGEKLARATNNASDRLHLASVQGNLGFLLWRIHGSGDEAGRHILQSLDARRRLVESFPSAPEYRNALASALNTHGIWLRGAGRRREAEAAFLAASEEWRSLSEKHPQVASYQHDLGGALSNLASERIDRKEPAAARPLLEEAITRGHRAHKSNPQNALYLEYLNTHYRSLGQVLVALNLKSDAERVAREWLEYLQESESRHGNPDIRVILARAFEQMGRIDRESGRHEAAEQEYRQSIAVWKQLVAESPDNANYRSELGAILNNASLLLWKQERLGDAVSLLEEAIQHQELALKTHPRHAQVSVYFLNHHMNLADLRIAQGEHVLAMRFQADVRGRFPKVFDDYGWAVRLARCIPLAENDRQLSTTERSRLAREYIERSVALLQAAREKKSKDLSRIHSEPLFHPLNEHQGFRILLASVPKPSP